LLTVFCLLGTQLLAQQAPSPGFAGIYQGMVFRHTGVPAPWPNAHLGARLDVTVAADLTYTGKIISPGTTLTFKGSITDLGEYNGTSTTTITRGSQPELGLNLTFSGGSLSGSLTNSGSAETAEFGAWKKIWDAKTHPATEYVGRYNFHLMGRDVSMGIGFGTVTIPASGDVTIRGKLPDGNSFSTKGFLGPDGHILIYQTLYAKTGSFLGWLYPLPKGSPDEPLIWSVMATWYKPDQRPTADRLYPEGFLTEVNATGGLYVKPHPGDVAAGLLDMVRNGLLAGQGTAQSSATPLNSVFTLDSAGKLTMETGLDNPAKATLKLNPDTGDFSGTFSLVDEDQSSPPIRMDADGNAIFRKVTRSGKFEGLIVALGTEIQPMGYSLMPSMPDASATPAITLANSPVLSEPIVINHNAGGQPLTISLVADSLEVDESMPGRIQIGTSEVLTKPYPVTFRFKPGTGESYAAASEADLTTTKQTVILKAGSTGAFLPLPVRDDSINEDTESFLLVMEDGPGFEPGGPTTLEFVIRADKAPTPAPSSITSQIVAMGDIAVLEVIHDGGDKAFEWRRDGKVIPGARSATLTFPQARLSDAGKYQVKVTEDGINTYLEAELAVADTRSLTAAHRAGETAGLGVTIAGVADSFSYSWRKYDEYLHDDTGPNPRITGTDKATLTIRDLTEDEEGTYTCEVVQKSSGNGILIEWYLDFPIARPQVRPAFLPAGQVSRPYEHAIMLYSASEAVTAFSATGLPAGLVIDARTGVISGTPTAAIARTPVTITASNPIGSSSFTALLTIEPYPAGAVGSFQGLVDRVRQESEYEPPVWPWANLGARLEVETTKTGEFSGKIIHVTMTPFSGQLAYDASGQLTGEVSVSLRGKDLPPAYLKITLDTANQRLFGTLAEMPGWVEEQTPGYVTKVWGWRNRWSKASPASLYQARYHFAISNNSELSNGTPSGTGYGSCVIPATGTFNVSGMLPDGTAFVSNTFLGPQGQLLLYQPLYKTPGSLMGALQITSPEEDTGLPQGMLPSTRRVSNLSATSADITQGVPACTWNKPFQEDPKEKLYRQGYPELVLIFTGGCYQAPEPGAVIMNLPEAAENAQLMCADLVDQTLTISPGGGVRFPTGTDANPTKASLNVNHATGLLKGTFTHLTEDPSKPAVYDDITGRLIRAQGYFARKAQFSGLVIPRAGTMTCQGTFSISELLNAEASPPITAENAPMVCGPMELFLRESGPTLRLSLGDGVIAPLSEDPNDGTGGPITLRMDPPQETRRTFTLSLEHFTTTPADISLLSTKVVFEPGETETVVLLAPVQDNVDEDNEACFLKVADGTGYDVIFNRLPLVLYDDDETVKIIQQPIGTLAATGENAGFFVEATGSEPLYYQWRRNGVPIPGEIGTSCYRERARLSDGGIYDVVISNKVGTIISEPAGMTVVDNAERLVPTLADSSATLSLRTAGPMEGLSLQWVTATDSEPMNDSLKLSGSQTATLKINHVESFDAGYYFCFITRPAEPTGTDPALPDPVTVQSGVFAVSLVSAPPDLLAMPVLTGTVARPFLHPVAYWQEESFQYPASFSATGLPVGLVIDPATGLISGIPQEAVTNRSITVTATNPSGSDSVTTTLTITALPRYAVGTYHGYVGRAETSNPDLPDDYFKIAWEHFRLGGLMEVTITESGSFSGKFIQNGSTFGFTGWLYQPQANFSYEGEAVIERPGKLALTFQFNMADDDVSLGGYLDGYLGTAQQTSMVHCWQKVWSPIHPADAYAGSYHFSLKTNTEGSLGPYPGGTGYASCIVLKNGSPLVIKGRLPDGVPFVCSSLLGPRGQLVLHQNVYARPGSLLVPARLATEPDAPAGDPVFLEGGGDLFKPAQTAASETLYRSGFGPMEIRPEGGRSPTPPKGGIVMNLPDVADNAYVTFWGAGAEGSATQPYTLFRIMAGGATRMKTGTENTAKVAITVNPAASEFSGSFTLRDPSPLNESVTLTRTASFQGVFIQHPTQGMRGVGYFTAKSLQVPIFTTLNAAPTLTGSVQIVPGL